MQVGERPGVQRQILGSAEPGIPHTAWGRRQSPGDRDGRHGASRCCPAVRAGGGLFPGAASPAPSRGGPGARLGGLEIPIGGCSAGGAEDPAAPRSRHDPRESAAGGGAGEAQRGAAAALEEEAVPADREGAAALRAQGLAPQGAELCAHEGGGVRGVEGAAHLLHRGDGRQPRDRFPLRPGGPGLERRNHHGPRPLQEPAGDPDRAGTAQLQSSGAVRRSPTGPARGPAASQEPDGDGARLGGRRGERDPGRQLRPPPLVALGRTAQAPASPSWSRTARHRRSWAAGLELHPFGPTGQRTQPGPLPGALDMTEVTSPPGGPLSFSQRGQDCGGLAETPRPLLRDRGWDGRG